MTAVRCAALIAHLPADLLPGSHQVRVTPASPYTAAFGSPAVTVRCGLSVPAHDPLDYVEVVDGVDWLQLPARRDTEHLVSYHAAVILQVDVPHRYLPADVLSALSPLVAQAG